MALVPWFTGFTQLTEILPEKGLRVILVGELGTL